MLMRFNILLLVILAFTGCQSSLPESVTPLATPTPVALIVPNSPLQDNTPVIITLEPTRAISATGTPMLQVEELPPVESFLTPDHEVLTETVTFKSDDNTQLSGTLLGQGKNLVIIVPAQNETGLMWAKQAEALAIQGFMVLTYDVREPNKPANLEKNQADLKAAIAFGKGRGATQHILIGSGEGCITVAKVAPESQPKGVTFFSPPQMSGEQNLTYDDMRTLGDIPKLFVDGQNSPTQPGIVQLFEAAENPKTWGFFPGTNQGARLYDDPETGPKITNFMAVFFLSRLSK